MNEWEEGLKAGKGAEKRRGRKQEKEKEGNNPDRLGAYMKLNK